MKQKILFLFALLALLCGSIPTPTNASVPHDVLISELSWAGSSLSAADEWVELANISNEPVDVSGWSLSGASNAPIVFPAGSLIEAHTTFLITNYANTNTSTALNTSPQIVTTMVSLPNEKFAITLNAPDRGVVDSAGNGGAPFAGESGGTGDAAHGRYRSMERISALLEGNTKDAWTHAETSNGFKDTTLDQGTPGSLNTFLQTHLIENASASTVSAPLIATEPATAAESEHLCSDVVIDTPVISTPEQALFEPIVEQSVLPSVPETEPTPPSPTQETTIPEISVTSPQGTLRISEIFSRPALGDSEWVEVENYSAYPVTTNGWSILDASSASTAFPNEVILPGAFLVIENPKGKLNNDGDSVVLKDANGSVVESVLYNTDLGSVPNENESLVRTQTNTLVVSTTPTKNSSNILTPRPPKITTSTSHTTPSTPNTANTTNTEPTVTNTQVSEVALPPLSPQTSPTPLTPPTSPVPQGSPIILKTLRLSELYPNTGGNDVTHEFIEIENTGDQSVSLHGWILKDASGTTFLFSKDAMIAANTFNAFLRPETDISLNNDGDTIVLIAPDGAIVDTQTYDHAKSTFSFARTENLWNWTTTPTPNEPNVVSGNSPSISTATETGTSSTSNTSSTTQSNGTNTPFVLTIDEAKLRPDGTRIKIRGVVTALPNTFNSQTMYVQDATGGIQIYKNDCIFPTLAEGQSVTITGVLSHVSGEARLKVMNQTSMIVGSTISAIAPNTVAPDDDSSVGSLMTIAGIITSKSGTRLGLNVDGNTWNIDLPKTTATTYRTGDAVQISGILANTKNGTVLKARSEQDVTPLPKADTKQPAPNIMTTESTESKQTLAIVLILLSSLAFIGLKLRPRFYALTQSYGRKPSLPPRA